MHAGHIVERWHRWRRHRQTGGGAGFLEAVAAGNTAGSEAVARLGSAGEMREPGKEHRL
jgi:hypothetical protein